MDIKKRLEKILKDEKDTIQGIKDLKKQQKKNPYDIKIGKLLRVHKSFLESLLKDKTRLEYELKTKNISPSMKIFSHYYTNKTHV
jgi:hypothetical protein